MIRYHLVLVEDKKNRLQYLAGTPGRPEEDVPLLAGGHLAVKRVKPPCAGLREHL